MKSSISECSNVACGF